MIVPVDPVSDGPFRVFVGTCRDELREGHQDFLLVIPNPHKNADPTQFVVSDPKDRDVFAGMQR